jgi:hypothetical protein
MALKRYKPSVPDGLLVVSNLHSRATESGRTTSFTHGTSTPRHGNSIFVEIRDAGVY